MKRKGEEAGQRSEGSGEEEGMEWEKGKEGRGRERSAYTQFQRRSAAIATPPKPYALLWARHCLKSAHSH